MDGTTAGVYTCPRCGNVPGIWAGSRLKCSACGIFLAKQPSAMVPVAIPVRTEIVSSRSPSWRDAFRWEDLRLRVAMYLEKLEEPGSRYPGGEGLAPVDEYRLRRAGGRGEWLRDHLDDCPLPDVAEAVRIFEAEAAAVLRIPELGPYVQSQEQHARDLDTSIAQLRTEESQFRAQVEEYQRALEAASQATGLFPSQVLQALYNFVRLKAAAGELERWYNILLARYRHKAAEDEKLTAKIALKDSVLARMDEIVDQTLDLLASKLTWHEIHKVECLKLDQERTELELRKAALRAGVPYF